MSEWFQLLEQCNLSNKCNRNTVIRHGYANFFQCNQIFGMNVTRFIHRAICARSNERYFLVVISWALPECVCERVRERVRVSSGVCEALPHANAINYERGREEEREKKKKVNNFVDGVEGQRNVSLWETNHESWLLEREKFDRQSLRCSLPLSLSLFLWERCIK